MKRVSLTIGLTDDLGIKSVVIDYNDTGLLDDSVLIEKIALTLIKSIYINKEDIYIQDILNELNIKRES